MTLDRYFLFLYDSSKINLWSLVANQNDSDIGYNNYVCKVNTHPPKSSERPIFAGISITKWRGE